MVLICGLTLRYHKTVHSKFAANGGVIPAKPESPELKIELKEVTAENFEEVIDLEVAHEQKDYVADNVFSIAESRVFPEYQPRVIYKDGTVVGFLMYESLSAEGKPDEFDIFRFMVGEKYQNKGVGRIAMNLVLEEIKSYKNAKRIRICYVPTNSVAKTFYSSFGFTEIGVNREGEITAEILV